MNTAPLHFVAPATSAPLKHLGPGWFAPVMGWAGLALAWQQARPLLGEAAGGLALAAAGVAALLFALLLALSLLRLQRHPQALREDLRHPVRHAFVATVPVSLLLLATLAVAAFGPQPALRPLWALGALAQFGVTLWVLSRWIAAPPAGAGAAEANGNGAGGLQWAGITPLLFIPVVGNVVVPLAGLPLGQPAWSAAQFALGLFFWPLLLGLFVVRLGVQGPLPARLAPALFITIAPPAVAGSALLEFGAPVTLAWGAWGLALFFALWSAMRLRAIAAQPFGLPHWGMSFPLAAFAALTLRLQAAPGGAGLQLAALALLALASLVIAGLSLATWRGLRAGTLLVPELAAAAPLAAMPAGGQ